MHYFDHASTTRVLPEVCDLVYQTLAQTWGNPSQEYDLGTTAYTTIEHARKNLAEALGCKEGEVFFTASGTEANNLALWGVAEKCRDWARHVVVTGYEHPSVQKPVEEICRRYGYACTVVAPGPDGNIKTEDILAAVTPKTALVTAMHANNETGAILDVLGLAAQIKEKNRRTAFHSDGVQAFCKLPLKLGQSKIDTYAVSGHKIGAPKGIGALYVRSGHSLAPLLQGGEQEKSLRPGTENTAYIAGLGLAAERMAVKDTVTPLLHAALREKLGALPGVKIHSPENGICGILNIALPNIYGSTMVNWLAQDGIYTSVGSACQSKSDHPNHTLMAMGLAAEEAKKVLRISVNRFNTMEDVEALVQGLARGLVQLQKINR